MSIMGWFPDKFQVDGMRGTVTICGVEIEVVPDVPDEHGECLDVTGTLNSDGAVDRDSSRVQSDCDRTRNREVRA